MTVPLVGHDNSTVKGSVKFPPARENFTSGAKPGPLLAFSFPTDRLAAPGIALYATGLAAMAAMAWLSDFPRSLVSFGALLFAVSDLLIFARLGPLAGSIVPDLLVWPLYFGGQAMIAWGVARSLATNARP